MGVSSRALISAISTLKQYSACDLADSLAQNGIKGGGEIAHIVQRSLNLSGTPSVGKAYTVTFALASDPRPAVNYIDHIEPGSVVVIALEKSLQCKHAPYLIISNSMYGGLMSARAQYQKCEGTIVLGNIRDTKEHQGLQYPVWSYGTAVCAPNNIVKPVAINQPVYVLAVDEKINLDLGDVKSGLIRVESDVGDIRKYNMIMPGDLIVADCDGAARIPLSGKYCNEEWLENVVSYIPKRVAADKLVLEDIKEGKEAKYSQKLRRANIS